MNSRLALGTVQFGLRYGIANDAGEIARDEISAILAYARLMGLSTLDTAISYGESERRLGEIGVEDWQIVTKLPRVPENCRDVTAWTRESVLGSLQRLKVSRLYGLLLHRSQDLTGEQGDALYGALLALKDQDKTEKIGVSIYDPEELDAIWPRYIVDLVQAPFNVVDRRLDSSGWLARLNRTGVEVHVRSVFLQGLLLMQPANRPAAFNRWQPLWDRWQRWLEQASATSLEACLGFALSRPEISRVVFGVDSRKHLQEVLGSVGVCTEMPPQTLMSEDLNLINPSRWDAL